MLFYKITILISKPPLLDLNTVSWQLTLEKPGFEPHRSTPKWRVYGDSTVMQRHFPFRFSSRLFSSFMVRIQYVMHITYKIRANQVLMLLVRLPANSRLSRLRFGGVKVTCKFLTVQGGSYPNPHILQGSTVINSVRANKWIKGQPWTLASFTFWPWALALYVSPSKMISKLLCGTALIHLKRSETCS